MCSVLLTNDFVLFDRWNQDHSIFNATPEYSGREAFFSGLTMSTGRKRFQRMPKTKKKSERKVADRHATRGNLLPPLVNTAASVRARSGWVWPRERGRRTQPQTWTVRFSKSFIKKDYGDEIHTYRKLQILKKSVALSGEEMRHHKSI